MLTFAEMCVDAHVSRGACQTLVLPVRDVLVCVGVNILFRQTKVYYIHHPILARRLATNQKVLRLDVAVDELLGVYVFHPLYLRPHKREVELRTMLNEKRIKIKRISLIQQ